MEQRQMRFRAWVSAEYIGEDVGVMHTADEDSDFRMIGDANGFGLVDGDFNLVGPEHFVIMQCTGKKDKTGRDIYEGDIVRLGLVNGIVGWDDDFACFSIREQYNHEFDETELLEVIGNIYANPGLVPDGRSSMKTITPTAEQTDGLRNLGIDISEPVAIEPPKHRRVKLRVLSVAHNAAFQRAVFESGGWWASGGQTIRNLDDAAFLYVDRDGVLSYGVREPDKYFLNHEYTEITFPDPEAQMEITDEDRDLLARIKAAHEAGEPITLEPPEKVWGVPRGDFFLELDGGIHEGVVGPTNKQREFGNSYATHKHAKTVRDKTQINNIIHCWLFDHYPDYVEPEVGVTIYYPAFRKGRVEASGWMFSRCAHATGMSKEIFEHFKCDYESGRIPQLKKLMEGEK